MNDIIVTEEAAEAAAAPPAEVSQYEDVHVTLLWLRGSKVQRSVDLFARERRTQPGKGKVARTFWSLHVNGKAPTGQNKYRVSLNKAETGLLFGDNGLPTHADIGGERVDLDRGESSTGTQTAEITRDLADGRTVVVRTAIGRTGLGHVGVSAFLPRASRTQRAEVTELNFD